MQQLAKLLNPFKIVELRKRILFTLGIIALYRVGCAIPTPGIDTQALKSWFAAEATGIFTFFNLFSGGALENCSIFALGIMPYISASIIMSLLSSTIEYLKNLRKEGEAGQRKINQYTRYLTLLIAIIHGSGLSIFLQSQKGTVFGVDVPIVITPGGGFTLFCVLTLTAGAGFVMWLGEQISERGIGNGSSILIFSSILAGFPKSFMVFGSNIFSGTISPTTFLIFLLLTAFVLPATIILIQAHRKIPVQYATRLVGRRLYGGQSSYIPLQLNMGGVIPLIFASCALSFFATFAQAIQQNPILQLIPGLSYILALVNKIPQIFWSILYYILFIGGIVFFTYFYTALMFKPQEVADNLRKAGGSIPGIRPGKPTSEYFEKILRRTTFIGATALVIIAIIPQFMADVLKVGFLFTAAGLLIIVGVALDTIRQIESHMIMTRYEGFLQKGRIRGRF